MNCLTCQKDIGDKLGICDECKTQRANPGFQGACQDQEQECTLSKLQSLFHFLNENPQFLMLPLIVVALSLFIGQFVGDQNLNIQLSSQRIEFLSSDNNSALVFRRGSPTTFSGRIYSVQSNSFRIDNGGICGYMIAVSEKDFEELEKCRGCKAPFLNQYAKIFALLPSSSKELQQIRNTNLRYGDKISLKGEQVSFESGKIDGNQFNFAFSNSLPVLVSALEKL